MTDNIDKIKAQLQAKGNLKQEVYQKTLSVFDSLKDILHQVAQALNEDKDQHLYEVDFDDKGKFEVQLKFAGDVLIFNMHTNVFGFPAEHSISQLDYVKQNPANQYCGMIEVYNFLADSFKYSRMHDTGYMIARIFVNREGHFYVEGEDQLGFLYQEFDKLVINESFIKLIIEACIGYSIDFDLWIPPYQKVKELTVGVKIQQTGTLTHKTGKRLGFAFEADGEYKE